MKLETVFPKADEARYRYDFFKMVPPQQDSLLDFADLAAFEPEFLERYLVTERGLEVTRQENATDIGMIFRLEAAGLFAVGADNQDDHCVIPLPLTAGSRYLSAHGETEITEVNEDGFVVLERYTGYIEGYCKTRFAYSAWVSWQEVNTNRMHYVLRRTDPFPYLGDPATSEPVANGPATSEPAGDTSATNGPNR